MLICVANVISDSNSLPTKQLFGRQRIANCERETDSNNNTLNKKQEEFKIEQEVPYFIEGTVKSARAFNAFSRQWQPSK